MTGADPAPVDDIVSRMSHTARTPLEVVVLAAGKGKRMRSDTPKVLHELGGEPLLAHVLKTVKALQPEAIHVLVGHEAEQVRGRFPGEDVRWVVQEQQLGTGHAVRTALPGTRSGSVVLVVYGDIPLIGAGELSELVDRARSNKIALLTADFSDPQGYGRIVRDDSKRVVGIVEQKDAGPEQLAICEVNTGFIAADRDRLASWVDQISDENAQSELYLTDVVAIAAREGIEIADLKAVDPETVTGVNSRVELAHLEGCYRARRAAAFMEQGVTLIDPLRFDVHGQVRFGRDCTVDVNVVLEGPLEIGDGVSIGPCTIVRRSTLRNGACIRSHCVIEEAEVGAGAIVGPFARLRPGTRLAENVHIGNFVEVKNSSLDKGSKANHLSYVGDSKVGRGVNIGAGVITCNYDGACKHSTEIDDGAFIGSNSQLVAPVKVGRGANVGAGSTITKDVPPETLALGRARQKNIKRWKRPRKTQDDGK